MAHVNRRIGKSSETAITTTDGTGGGVLDAFLHDYFQRSGNVYNAPGESPSGITATGISTVGILTAYSSININVGGGSTEIATELKAKASTGKAIAMSMVFG